MTPVLVGLWVALLLSAALSCQAAPFGAVYTLSNDFVRGNAVLVSSLSSTGQLTFVGAVPTGGLGGNNTAVSDALFSSHCVQVDRTRSLLLAVNAGSDSVSLFTINPSDPTSIAFVGSQPSGFQYPVSIALNVQRAIACVAHGGVVNGVRCFSYSASGLTVIPSWDRLTNVPGVTAPPTPVNGTSDIAFTPDGLSLVVAAHNQHGLIYMFPINYAANTLAASANVFTPLGSALPFSLEFFGTNSLLITDPGIGGASFFHYNSTTGTSVDALTIPAFNVSAPPVNVGAICWSAFSARTNSFYLIGATGDGAAVAPNTTIAEVQVDPVSLHANVVALHPAVPFVDSQDTVVISLNAATDVLLVLGPIGQVIAAYHIPVAGVMVSYQSLALQELPTGLRSLQGLDYALTAAATSVLGDPAFIGFHGQAFQMHGIPMRIFNLLSTPSLQLNALFSALEEGDAMTKAQMERARVLAGREGVQLPRTVAFAHAGTYLAEIGIRLGRARVHAVAGPYLLGMAALSLDGEAVEVSASAIAVDDGVEIVRPDAHTLVVRGAEVSFTMVNSDGFFNVQKAALKAPFSQERRIEGLLGQTADQAWAVELHSAEFRERQALDFLIASNDLFSSDFAANLFVEQQ